MERLRVDQWIVQGKRNCRSYVFYENKVLDLSQYMEYHPGGLKAIKNYIYKDITNILFQVYPHNRERTLNILMRYQVGVIPQEQVANIHSRVQKSAFNSEYPKQKKKVCFGGQEQKQVNGKSKIKQTSDSLTKSASKAKQNLKESTKKSNVSRQTSKSKSKGKKKQFITSIRVIDQEQGKLYSHYRQQSKPKTREAQRAAMEKHTPRGDWLGQCSFLNNQLDQQKPNFKVPVLAVKHMNRHY